MNRPLPSDDTRTKIFSLVENVPSRSRREQRTFDRLVRVAVVALLAFALAVLPIRVGRRSPTVVALLVLAWTLSAVCSWLVIARARSMIGRPGRELRRVLAVALVGPLVASLVVGLASADVPFARSTPCLIATLAVGALPTGALARRRIGAGGAFVGRRLVGAMLAVTGALVGGVVLVLHCPDASLMHLILGHVTAVPIAAASGALVVGRLLRPRPWLG